MLALKVHSFNYRNETIKKTEVIKTFKEKFHLNDVRYIEDTNYLYGEQTSSLMFARHEIIGDVIISFGDIIFDEKTDVFVAKIKNVDNDSVDILDIVITTLVDDIER